MIDAGSRRHVIVIQSLQGSGRGTRGQTQKTWQTKYNRVRAAITTLSGRELEIARQLVPTASHRVEIYGHYSGTTPKMRVKFGERILNIGHVNNVDQIGRELIMICAEEV